MHAEDLIERKGIPQIDFVLQNEINENSEQLAVSNPSLYRLKKF